MTGAQWVSPDRCDPAGSCGRARQAVGAYGERVAVRFLEGSGIEVLDRNWRCRFGEIDIVARDGESLVICEVKTRRSVAFGPPVEAVTPTKAARLRRLAGAWLAAHPGHAGTSQLRIDVLGVLVPRAGAPVVEHLVAVA